MRSVGYCRRGRFGWQVVTRHPGRSCISSCHLLTPERSLFTRSLHRSGAPPGGLLLPDGQYLISCFWMQWSGILQRCPSHCKRLCLSWSSTSSSPVLSRTTVFRSMFQRLTPRISLKHLIWKVYNFRVFCCVTAQVSAPYRRADITNVRNARILVTMLMFLLWNSFFSPHLIHPTGLL